MQCQVKNLQYHVVIIIIINIYHYCAHQGREGVGGGVPPNHMWTPYGFVPFQMGPGGQQVLPSVSVKFLPNFEIDHPDGTTWW